MGRLLVLANLFTWSRIEALPSTAICTPRSVHLSIASCAPACLPAHTHLNHLKQEQNRRRRCSVTRMSEMVWTLGPQGPERMSTHVCVPINQQHHLLVRQMRATLTRCCASKVCALASQLADCPLSASPRITHSHPLQCHHEAQLSRASAHNLSVQAHPTTPTFAHCASTNTHMHTHTDAPQYQPMSLNSSSSITRTSLQPGMCCCSARRCLAPSSRCGLDMGT